jgi:anti-sigma factor RsiW
MKTCIALASAIDDAALGATASDELSAHMATCEACAARLERRRTLARRIDRAVENYVRVEMPAGLPDRVGARASARRPRRWGALWLGLPAGVALVAGSFVLFSWLGGTHTNARPADIAALSAWRSPTASLLVSRTNVINAPFTLRGVRAATDRFHS